MRQPGLIRDYVLKIHDEGLKRIRSRLSCSDPFERDAYSRLEQGYLDALALLTDQTLVLLGHDTGEATDPRFDKTRRAANKFIGKVRGETDAA